MESGMFFQRARVFDLTPTNPMVTVILGQKGLLFMTLFIIPRLGVINKY